jgi:cell division protein FtsL
VSGPTTGRTGSPTAARAATAGTATRVGGAGTATRPATRTHRRRVVPRRAPFAPRRRSTRVRRAGPLPARAVAYIRALPDHPLLDRIVRGRAWIAMLGVMLVGIVAMQVAELKLGASVGRSLSESATLQSKNQLLRASVSALSDDQRIERLAARMGMVMPAPGDVVYLTPHTSADAARAANQIQPPSPSSFLASLPQATASSTSASTGIGTGTIAGTTLTSSSTTAGTTGASASASATATAPATAPATDGTTPTGTAAAGTAGTAGEPGTTGTSDTTGTAGTTPTTGPIPGTTGGVSVTPVSTGSGTTGN